jgi:hypothetical protein
MKKQEQQTPKKPSLKIRIIGMLIFPIALLFWCVDRLIHVIMPHATHNKFTDYLKEPQNMKWTIARIITLFVPFIIWKIIVWLIY